MCVFSNSHINNSNVVEIEQHLTGYFLKIIIPMSLHGKKDGLLYKLVFHQLASIQKIQKETKNLRQNIEYSLADLIKIWNLRKY